MYVYDILSVIYIYIFSIKIVSRCSKLCTLSNLRALISLSPFLLQYFYFPPCLFYHILFCLDLFASPSFLIQLLIFEGFIQIPSALSLRHLQMQLLTQIRLSIIIPLKILCVCTTTTTSVAILKKNSRRYYVHN